jgi:hypothetical protein
MLKLTVVNFVAPHCCILAGPLCVFIAVRTCFCNLLNIVLRPRMAKSLTQFLSFLCILLLGGFAQFDGHVLPLMADDCGQSENATVCIEPQLTIKPFSSASEKTVFRIEATEKEIEEDDLVFSKKSLQSNSSFAAVFFALILGYFFHSLRKHLAFCKRFSYFVSYRWYLMYGVIQT